MYDQISQPISIMAKSNHYSPFLARIYDSVLHIPIKKIRQRVAGEIKDDEYKKIIDTVELSVKK